MARRRSKPRKIRKLGTEELTRQAYSSAATGGPLHGPRFGFLSTKNGKVDVCVFRAIFAAKMYLDLMVADDDIEWQDGYIITSTDVIIKPTSCQDLEEIYDHRITYEEDRYYALGQEYLDRVQHIRSNSFAKAFIEGATHKSIRRHSRKGMTLIKAIARELKMDPRDARGILRQVMAKPDHGWAWRTEKEVDRIKAILTGESQGPILTLNFTEVRDA